MFLKSSESYKFTLHAITSIASPLHVLGIYCIISLTPKNMGSAKWYLLNLHVSCILLDWGITVLAVPYLILPVMGGYPLGVFEWFGVPVVVQIYVVMTTVFVWLLSRNESMNRVFPVVLTSIVLIFENRFYQLYARNSSWRYLRIPFIVINYMLDATHVLIKNCVDQKPDQKLALEFALKVYLFIGLINRNMNLESRSFTRSENTINLQRKFLNAIKAQLIVLAINFILHQTYSVFSINTQYYKPFAINLDVVIVSLHGINSTLIMLWAHKTYSEFCIKNFKKISSFLGYTPSVSTVSLQPIDSITVLT